MSENENEIENNEASGDDLSAAMEEQAVAEGDEANNEQIEADSVEDFNAAEFPEFEEKEQDDAQSERISDEELNLDVILDVPVTISMEIGRTRINIRNLLQLNQGSVVELDRFSGEPMDVLVNGTLIAHGEVVVVNDKFGIRLTDVISPSERVKKLG